MNRRSIYTKSLGGIVARDAKGSVDGKYHVVSSQTGKWAVVSEGSIRPVRSFSTQKAASTFAKKYAKSKLAGEVVIHEKNGKIQERISF